MKEFIPIEASSNETIFLIFTAILLLIGLLRRNERERFQLFLKSFTNSQMAEQQVRQERSFLRIGSYVFVITLLVIGVFSAQLMHAHSIMLSFSFGALFTLISLGILIVVALRMAIFTAFSWLFEVEDLQLIHTFHWLQSSFFWALTLLPISILYAFGAIKGEYYLLTMGLISGMIFFLVRTFRVFIAGHTSYRIHVIYNIFYLCALEFLPLIIVITVIFRQELG